jgi:hypothetical protein
LGRDLFNKLARGALNKPLAEDAQLLRRAVTDDRPAAILRSVYP